MDSMLREEMKFNIPATLSHDERDALVAETMDNLNHHVNPALVKWRKSGDARAIEWSGRDYLLIDLAGNEYIDCLGGYGVFNFGHLHPKIVNAVKTQIDHMGISSQELLNPHMGRFAKLISQITPGNLQFTFFCNSGTEASEASIKFAMLASGKRGIIVMDMGYHGKTLGALSATFRDVYRKPFEPLLPGFKPVPFNKIDALAKAVDDTIGAVMMEPVQGEGGIIVPDNDYLPKVRQLCDDKKLLLIFDEVQSGMGRTGRNFACQNWNVAPDIMGLAKALGGGIMPVGACTATPEVWKFLEPNPFIHSNTFGGNPLACAAGIAAIEVLVTENIAERAADTGKYFKAEFEKVMKDFPDLIMAVRGIGLMIGVEFHEKEPAVNAAKLLFSHHVLTAHTMNNPKVIRIEPPLTIPKSACDEVIRRFRTVLDGLKK
jgi:putrescine aminotransferase